MSFPTQPIGELCDLINGKAFKPTDWGEAGEPIIRIQNLNNLKKSFNYWDGPLDRQVIVQPNDVLFAWSGTPGTSFGGHVWKGPKGVLNQHIFRVDLDERQITKAWFVRAINYKLNVLIDQAHGGVGLQHVTRGMVDRLEIPLPPLDEQQRIGTILDQAEALGLKRRKSIDALTALVKSIFHRVFGDPIKDERNWGKHKIKSFVSAFEGGKNLVSEDETDPSARFRVLKISAVGKRGFDPGESKALPDNYMPPASHFVRPGDLLISRANTTELVGRVAYVHTTPNNLVLPDKIWRFVWANPAAIHPKFMEFMMGHPSVRYELGRLASGTSGSMQNISQQKLYELSVILPPTELQNSFGEEVALIDKTLSMQRAHLIQLDALFSSIQHRAFRGEL